MVRVVEIPHSSLCTNVERITVHKKSSTRRLVLISVLILAYALVLPSVFSTMGKPLERALEQARILEQNKTLATDTQFIEEAHSEVVVTLDDDENQNEEDSAIKSRHVSSRSEDATINETKPKLGSSANNTLPERPLPSVYLPDALPLFLLLLVLSATCLHYLLGRWFVIYKVFTEYEPEERGMVPGAFVHVVPQPHRGKDAICPIVVNEVTGELEFSFQRQTYVWIPAEGLKKLSERLFVSGESARDDAIDADDEDLLASQLTSSAAMDLAQRRGYIRIMLAETSQNISYYLSAQGITNDVSLKMIRSRFGPNTLSVPQPPFSELLKGQLLMPLSVFQLFSALLWAVDEYIQYTIFTLITIVMMESTTAFQRHRTMSQLKGLSPKAFGVYVKRKGTWTVVPTDELLPGDLISLRTAEIVVAQDGTLANASNQVSGDPATQIQQPQGRMHQDTIVPCDVLILSGTAIVNEATLTGESIPQMKDALVEKESGDRPLDVDGKDRIHTLFSGTSLVAFTSAQGDRATPDGGCLCLVLRTGFNSSQGELMQMIEFSSQAVSADSKETGAALLILLVFALISAGYVFKRGMEKGDRTTHELLLKCIIIVTSVVPRQLPVQMALAVNHALMSLLGEGIYCTEPYKVPEAGKVTHALFDKTGTLTADELTPIGISDSNGETLLPMREANPEATLVLAGCHSLVSLGPTTVMSSASSSLAGDPIEVAAIRGVGWGFDATASRAFAGDTSSLETNLARVRERLRAALENGGMETNKNVVTNLQEEEKSLVNVIVKIQQSVLEMKYSELVIERRFHFEAALQRMSVIAKVSLRGSKSFERFVLCKGSPEALKKLCASTPDWYDSTYRHLAERGMRVLSLGVKKLKSSNTSVDDLTRRNVESELTFVGFVAFEAKIRGDSASVIKSLKSSAIGVAMVTGDAPLTALHVAKKCGFTNVENINPLMLDATGEKWIPALSTSTLKSDIPVDFSDSTLGMNDLAKNGHDLVITEEALTNLARKSQGKVWQVLEFVCVFSRMSPRGKARVIRSLQKSLNRDGEKRFVLMCGDGGNDVGALKQADVGLALLSGYGSANTSASSANDSETKQGEPQNEDAEEKLNETMEVQKKKATHLMKLRNQELEVKRKQLIKHQAEWMQEEIAKLPENERGISAQFGVMKNVAARLKRELQAEAMMLDKKYGLAAVTADSSAEKNKDDPWAALEGAESSGVPMVRPGDASVAAPFTSRIPSVRSVVQLIRQGRCTLLSSLQQQQIMMLECTISAYTYAAISLEGSRSSERQMMVSGWLIMAASLSFSYSTPINRMHPVRPLRSLFHPAVFLSIFGQAVIHLYAMSSAVKMATDAMGADKIAEVVAFNKRVQAGMEVEEDEDDPLKMLTSIWHRPFMPNLMNTTVFLVETAQIMAVLFVNYKGRPFMKGLLDNHALFLSLFICIGGVAFAAWEVLPEANKMLHFYPFPDDAYRWTVMRNIFLVVGGTFIWDRLMTAIFAPKVFRAMVDEAKATRPFDLIPILTSLGKTIIGFAIFSTGNPIIWGGAYYAYRQYKNRNEEAEARRLGLIRN